MNLTVGTVVAYINEHRCSTKVAAEHFELGYGMEQLRRRLNGAGYWYDGASKQWVGGDESLLLSEISTAITAEKSKPVAQFSEQEVTLLREMMNAYEQRMKSVEGLMKSHERRMKLNEYSDLDMRKTVVISRRVGEMLDEYCRRTNAPKGALISAAIEEFLKRS